MNPLVDLCYKSKAGATWPSRAHWRSREPFATREADGSASHLRPQKSWRAYRAKGEIHCNAVPVVRLDVKGPAGPAIL
eukprot:2954636-Pyramimonas_sp.AAC.1